MVLFNRQRSNFQCCLCIFQTIAPTNRFLSRNLVSYCSNKYQKKVQSLPSFLCVEATGARLCELIAFYQQCNDWQSTSPSCSCSQPRAGLARACSRLRPGDLLPASNTDAGSGRVFSANQQRGVETLDFNGRREIPHFTRISDKVCQKKIFFDRRARLRAAAQANRQVDHLFVLQLELHPHQSDPDRQR